MILAGILEFPAAALADASSRLSLKKCTPLLQPTSQHGCAVVGNRLYVFGGYADGIWEDRVFSCDIRSPGELGSWRAERSMPEPRAYIGTSVEAVNDRIYVVGGSVALEAGPSANARHARDVFMTSVLRDGTLGPWQRSPGDPGIAVSCAATCSTDRFLFLTGGNLKGAPSRAVLRAEFARDGTPRNWTQAATLPVPLWFHGAAILGDRMYIWGGLTEMSNSAINRKVYSAPVGRDGSVGEWRTETEMPSPVYSSAFCGFNDYLISVGGRYVNGYPTNVIWYSRLENGRPGRWEFLKTDSEAMAFLALGLDRATGVVYVVGGQYKTRPGTRIEKILDTVQAFHMAQPPSSRIEVADGGGIADGVLPLAEALEKARREKKPVLIFFYSPEVPDCKPFWEKLQKSGAVERAREKYLISSVDISKADPALSYRYSVFKVPCLVRVSEEGEAYGWTFRVDEVSDF